MARTWTIAGSKSQVVTDLNNPFPRWITVELISGEPHTATDPFDPKSGTSILVPKEIWDAIKQDRRG